MTDASPHEPAAAAAAAQLGEQVLDVRTAPELASGRLPRAFRAWQYRDQQGYTAIHAHGGMVAWRSQGLPIESGLPAQMAS